MFYYAIIEQSTGICYSISEEEDEVNNSLWISIDSYDESYLFRKKYVNGEWVDTTADEARQYKGEHIGIYHEWLDNYLGDKSDLSTTDKTSLVAAVNECFQSASDGKTAIANAITGADSSITIPENPTFEQLATLIGQFSGRLKVAIGSMSEFTIPATIEGTTPFKPKIVIIYNFGSGLSNFNMGVYVSPDITGVTTQQITDSANGIGNSLSRRANAFTITDNGFSMINTGAVTNLKWIALGFQTKLPCNRKPCFKSYSR